MNPPAKNLRLSVSSSFSTPEQVTAEENASEGDAGEDEPQHPVIVHLDPLMDSETPSDNEDELESVISKMVSLEELPREDVQRRLVGLTGHRVLQLVSHLRGVCMGTIYEQLLHKHWVGYEIASISW